MESRTTESERCYVLAEKCVEMGDLERAVRFLRQANRLCPSAKIEEKLEEVERHAQSTGVATEFCRQPQARSKSVSPSRCHDKNRSEGATFAAEGKKVFDPDNGDTMMAQLESDRFFEQALQMQADGYFDKAKTMLLRAQGFMSSERITEKLEEIERLLDEQARRNAASKAPPPAASSQSTSPRRRRGSGVKKHYTHEQLAEIKRIQNLTGRHYAVLGVKKGAATADIKKAYNALALKVHPDKTGDAPGAKEAFQAIAEAQLTLSDTVKRRDYDACGGDDAQSDGCYYTQPPPGGEQPRDSSSSSYNFFEELRRRNTYREWDFQSSHETTDDGRRTEYRAHFSESIYTRPVTVSDFVTCLGVFACVIFVGYWGIYLYINLPVLVYGAPYSLERTGNYDVYLQTPSGLTFYARQEWYEKARSDYAKMNKAYKEVERLTEEKRAEKRAAEQRARDETAAERKKLHDACELERTTKERKMSMAKTVEEVEAAQHLQTPSCRKLKKLRS